MRHINDLMEEIEMETKYIMVDGEPVAILTVIDRILSKDKKKRYVSEG